MTDTKKKSRYVHIAIGTGISEVTVSSEHEEDKMDKLVKILQDICTEYNLIRKWGGIPIKCPKCGGKTAVDRTIFKNDRVFRYRRCYRCKNRFKTIEIENRGIDPMTIIKKIKDLVNDV